MYHTPLTWYEQESLGHKAHFRGLVQSTVVSASLRVVSWITKTLTVGRTGRYSGSQNP
jgi:hypothetical protein